MSDILTPIKMKLARRIILAEGYYFDRLNKMDGEIQYWKRSQQHATTRAGRNYCNMMINMYLHRYTYYINK